MMLKRSILAVSVLSVASGALADNRQGFYAGGGVGFIDSGVGTPDGGAVGFNALEFFGGYKLSPYVGGEVRLGFGLSDDKTTVSINGVAQQEEVYEIPYTASLYYRVESANQVAKLYGLLGFSIVGIDATVTTITGDRFGQDDNPTGLSYGGGIGFVVNPRANINIEYRTLLSDENYNFEIVSLTYDFRF